jgi:hypothetical protein
LVYTTFSYRILKESTPIETYTGKIWIPALDGASRKKA